MCDSLQFRLFEANIPITSKLFDCLVTQYTESQSWNKLNQLIGKCNIQNCDASPKIVSYLKKNLVYCFDTDVRSQIKENIEQFEQKFFSKEGREARRDRKSVV